MKVIRRCVAVLLFLLITSSVWPLGAGTAKAAPLPQAKTVSVTVKLNGVHSAGSFSATRSYDDGQYAGTLTRQNNTLRSVVRTRPTVTYTYRSDIRYPNDKPASGQFNFSSSYASSYYDAVSGQSFPATLSRSGSPYFSGSVASTTLHWTHYGYQYDPLNHTKLGYMSNNSSAYYSGRHRFSDPPRQPVDYYGPPAEAELGWVQYKAPEWDGALQDAEREPWRSICMAYFCRARFRSEAGNFNRYRKPVRIFYRRTANSQYIYQDYTGRATVTDTEITYTGAVYLKNVYPDIEVIDSTITDWYAGKDVTVSATVRNNTAQPVPSVDIRLKIGGMSYTESIPIAGNGSNLAVFRITVPPTGNYTIEITADPENKLNEIDKSNNTLTKTIQVKDVPDSMVADPDDTAMEQRYKAYGLSSLSVPSSSNYHTWQEVRLENGSYVTKNYYVRLTTAFTVLPDERIAYADKPRQMESGFGFTVHCTTTLTTNYDHPEKLVGAQMFWVRYPESAYGELSAWQNVRDSLEVKTGEAGDTMITWQLAVNPYSVTGSRFHYTPLWYPNGEYVAWAQAFYAWSPIGQLYEYKTDTLMIEGDMYDRITTIKR